MCLIAWNWQPQSPTPLLLIANRDEYYARPTQPLHWWADADILAGRDLQAGGTWLGVSRSGHLAALTNHRDPTKNRLDAQSRGELVSAFLRSDLSAQAYVEQLATHAGDFNPFNLLVFDGQCLLGFESGHTRCISLAPGFSAVSNANFHTPWPKLVTLQNQFQVQLAQGLASDTQLLTLLQNRQIAADQLLPNTGIPLALERALSATFIAMPDYGTRACSVVRIGLQGGSFLEQTFTTTGPQSCQHISWEWSPTQAA